MAVYTHNFKLKIGDENVSGEIEFNIDGKASYRLDEGEAFDNLTLDQSHRINALFQAARNIFVEFGKIENIRIKEKD